MARVLIVEDDPDGQELVSRMLHHHHIEVDMVENGEAALSLLDAHAYAGVVIDLRLPGMSGWLLLRNIQEKYATPKLPCIAITAYHSPEVAMEAKRAGFAAYFPKPLEAGEFIHKIQSLFS